MIRETFLFAPASLRSMKHRDRIAGIAPRPSIGAAASGPLWLLLGIGLLLLAVGAATASGETVTRTDSIRATLAPGQIVRVRNVNGDVSASSGAAFGATVTLGVSAPTRARAQELLGKTRVAQSTEDAALVLETEWPEEAYSQGESQRHAHMKQRFGCPDCRVTARYELTLPPGISARLETVNGDVRATDIDGTLDLHTVNGNVIVIGARRALDAQTVNGRLEAGAAVLPRDASWNLQTVNGAVLATLPKDARFQWTASTMSGAIASTFALPVRTDEAAIAPPAAPAPPPPAPAPAAAPKAKTKTVVVTPSDGDEVIDVSELTRQIEESLHDVEIAAGDQGRGARHIRVMLPQRSYSATFGGGGASLRMSTMHGNITLLSAGSREADARALVSGSRSIVVTVPRVEVQQREVRVRVPRIRVHTPRVEPETPETPEPDEGEETEVVRGDVAGDFFSTSNASYRIGNVAGRVKVLTHSGEIHLTSAGKGAELKTFGGDIRLGSVHGDLKAQTLAGDIKAGEVTGAAVVETSGGDIRIDRVGGAVNARTDGGDIVLPAVGGAVSAETAGGEVRVALVGRSVKGGVTIVNAGGDVLLTLPPDFQADVDLRVDGPADPEDVLIRSDFPEIAVTRASDGQRASGTLNGGGPRLVVKTSSGSIRLRRAAATATP